MTPEQEMRHAALEAARGWASGATPEEIVQAAQQFYEFIAQTGVATEEPEIRIQGQMIANAIRAEWGGQYYNEFVGNLYDLSSAGLLPKIVVVA